MGVYLDSTDFPGVRNADELIAELEVTLALDFPCLADLPIDRLQLLKDVLKPVIRRWADVGTGITTSETAGRFSRSKSNGGGHVLWEHERSRLRVLCTQPASAGALPLGHFPEPESIADLFARRPSWPRP